MITDLPLNVTDLARLFLETIERAGLMHADRETMIREYRRIVTEGIRCIQDAEHTVPFAEAVRRSLESRRERRPSTRADLRSYTGRMLKHADWAQKALRSIRTEECRKLLQNLFGHSLSSYRKGRCILHSIFAYAQRQGWCDNNPVANIEIPVVREKRIEILQPNDIQRLRQACLRGQREMEAPLTLMLWCGIRPGEIRRMNWEDVDWQEGVAYIEPRVSKTGGPRVVELRGPARNLRPPEGAALHSPIAPPNWDKRWHKLRRQAGLERWQQDALRHTFASMHLRHFRNPVLLQAEMGHRDSTLLRTRYLNLRKLSPAIAKHFWNFKDALG